MKKLMQVIAILLLFASCDHREMVDPVNTHYVKVYIDDKIKNVTGDHYDDDYIKPDFKYPTVIRLALYDKDTGNYRFDRFLTKQGYDEGGHYLDGYIACDAGDYKILAYNWDTEIAIIDQPNNYYKANAYTGLAPTKAESTYNAPDFLFVARDEMHITNTQRVDTLYSSNKGFFKAESIVETYYIQISLKGLSGASNISATVSGMSGSERLSDGAFGPSPVSLYSTMRAGKVNTDITDVYATVNTFGHYPGADSSVHLVFYLDLIDGKTYTLDIDITDEFNKDDAINNNWIIIDDVIDAPTPTPVSDGGFKPGVSQWEDVSADIPL